MSRLAKLHALRPAARLRSALAAALVLTLAGPLAALAETAPPAAATTPRPVVSEIVTGAALEARGFPGVIAAEVETTLGFQTSGRIESRPVKLGDTVTRGQVLATLDQITLAEDVEAAKAALRAAAAKADFAGQSLARAEELHARGVAPVATLEQVQAKTAAARAQLEAARADLARARDAARFGTLTAPSGGVVSLVLAEPGTVVTPGTPVLRLATEAGREAVIDVPEEVLAMLPAQARFRIEPRGEGGQAVAGTLRLIEPVAGASTRAHRLRIALSAEGARMRLGTLVTARLDHPGEPLLSLPREAVFDRAGQPMVWRIGAERRAGAVPVELGATIGTRVVIAAGLSEGDEVVTRGIGSLEEGQQLGERVAP